MVQQLEGELAAVTTALQAKEAELGAAVQAVHGELEAAQVGPAKLTRRFGIVVTPAVSGTPL